MGRSWAVPFGAMVLLVAGCSAPPEEASVRANIFCADPKLGGVVVGTAAKVNLVLITVSDTEVLKLGQELTVYRGSQFISKLAVNRVEDGWAACRELTEFRQEVIQEGDWTSSKATDQKGKLK
ncbi:MAG: hypothetical protein FD180_472 [Planctomycetota bacterium]|nr:MAG: hypothetical protein FD180_472 [Planctomycetota bacterium]